jgi:aspartyl-tRNA(Asn)/glutamyl-tRNA(Gln) amidotransferase subunit B
MPRQLPELPDAKRHRYENALGLSPYNAGVLTAEVDTARWFEALIAASAAKQGKAEADVAKQAANWLISELFGALNKARQEVWRFSPVNPEQGAELLALVADGTISGTIAKQVLRKDAGHRRRRCSDRRARGAQADVRYRRDRDGGGKSLADNADKVAQYKAGKEALFGFFVGQTMKAMQGKANPQVVNELLKKMLGYGAMFVLGE